MRVNLAGTEHDVTSGQLGAMRALAPSIGVEVTPVGPHDAGEIERTVTAFARLSFSVEPHEPWRLRR
jgi:hypothetical protein